MDFLNSIDICCAGILVFCRSKQLTSEISKIQWKLRCLIIRNVKAMTITLFWWLHFCSRFFIKKISIFPTFNGIFYGGGLVFCGSPQAKSLKYDCNYRPPRLKMLWLSWFFLVKFHNFLLLPYKLYDLMSIFEATGITV